jgi:hypothetical protein
MLNLKESPLVQAAPEEVGFGSQDSKVLQLNLTILDHR